MAPTPKCDAAAARAKAEAQGYGKGAALAFAGFLKPRDRVGPRGTVKEPVEAAVIPVEEATAHVPDSPTKLDELRERAEGRGYGRGAALAFAGLLSPESPALLETPVAERSWAALDEAARSLADDAFVETQPSPQETRWYDDRTPSPERQERRDAGATGRYRRKDATIKADSPAKHQAPRRARASAAASARSRRVEGDQPPYNSGSTRTMS